jgi:hypothetical protein
MYFMGGLNSHVPRSKQPYLNRNERNLSTARPALLLEKGKERGREKREREKREKGEREEGEKRRNVLREPVTQHH